MAFNYNDHGIVALLDKPSPNSFGMCPLITRFYDNNFCEVLGLSSGIKTISIEELDQLYRQGHILKVKSQLPKNLSNPVALWLGNKFFIKADYLSAPPLPQIDKTWHSPLKPHHESGKYTIKDCREAFNILNSWVTTTGIEALTTNNHEFAKLMNWTLPLSPITQASLYFTAPTNESKQRELKWQLRINQNPNNKVTLNDLIERHEKLRSQLIQK